MGDQAFVSLAKNDTYGAASLVLGDSLRSVNTVKTLALLVTKDVTLQLRDRLNEIWDFVIDIEELPFERRDFQIAVRKLNVWLLTRFKKCVFLSADTLVLQNIDELFDREELSAAPDSSWPDCFNSGVFVFVPSEDTYDALIRFADEQEHFDGSEQDLLNMFFKDWSRNISFHLPYVYNMVPSTSYTYAPAYNYFGKDVKVVHFRGTSKPWEHHYDYKNAQVASSPTSQGGNNQQAFIQEWWNRYNKLQQNFVHDETAAQKTGQDFQLHQQESKADLPNQEQKNAWERGDIDFMRKDRFSIIQNYLNNVIDGTEVAEYCEGEYQNEEDFYNYDQNEILHEEKAYCRDVPERNTDTANPNAFKLEINYETIDYCTDKRESVWDDGKHRYEDDENQFKMEKESDVTGAELDPDRTAQLRWESGIIDFTGEDKFEYIEEYLNSLLSGMENILNNDKEYTPVTTIETGLENLRVNGRTSPILSIADSAYSETTFHKVDMASKSTQISVSCVEAAVQTDFEVFE